VHLPLVVLYVPECLQNTLRQDLLELHEVEAVVLHVYQKHVLPFALAVLNIVREPARFRSERVCNKKQVLVGEHGQGRASIAVFVLLGVAFAAGDTHP
jgi:hypothetical protein